MNKALLSLAVAGLALAAVQTSFAQRSTILNQSTATGAGILPVNHFPRCGGRNSFFPLQQAYRLRAPVNTLALEMCPGACELARNTGWCGVLPGGGGTTPNNPNSPRETEPHYAAARTSASGDFGPQPCLRDTIARTETGGPELVTAVPGVFALCSVNKNAVVGGDPDFRQRINVNGFSSCPTGFQSPVIQHIRLEKRIPFQPKCPGVFPGAGNFRDPQLFVQSGGGNIRTWWALLYSPPGTEFRLRVTVACVGAPGTRFFGQTQIHIDQFVWKVCVTFESLFAVIDILHSLPLGTSEIPCIAAEDVYLALRLAVARIQCTTGTTQQDRLFAAEALIIAFCAFGDCFVAEDFFSVFPPSNDVDMNGAFGPTGILDTIENPCCCKLLVDLDNLGRDFGISTGPAFGDP